MAYKTLYTAHAKVSGGRDAGKGVTDDGVLDVQLSKPEGLGGDGGPGTNPEQLFAVGYAACFEGAMASVSGETDVRDAVINSSVEIGKTGDGLSLRVTLDVHAAGVDTDELAQIVRKAHQVCPYSRATRGNIEVRLQANGRALVD